MKPRLTIVLAWTTDAGVNEAVFWKRRGVDKDVDEATLVAMTDPRRVDVHVFATPTDGKAFIRVWERKAVPA